VEPTTPHLAVPKNALIATARYLTALARELPGELRRQRVVLALVLIYWLGGMAVGKIAGMPPGVTISTYLPTFMAMVPTMIVGMLIGRGLLVMTVDRPARPLTQLVREIRTTLATPQRIAHAIPILATMLIFGGTFTVVKASIPSLAPFAWDVPLEQFDRWLHGGTAPWEWLQPIIGFPIVTHAINWAYNFWAFLLTFVLVWQAFSRYDSRLRLRFFLTMFLGWILLGNVAAALFSSAGPCYFGRASGLPDPFLPLMSYLHDANQTHSVWSLTAQDILWQVYSMHNVSLGAGISAMPSMHVATATLLTLVCWRTKRWLGIVMGLYAMVIMIGSVHLAWHYAIDGYFGAAGMLAIWWCVGRAVALHGAMRQRFAVNDIA
jgi:hypothetical protein